MIVLPMICLLPRLEVLVGFITRCRLVVLSFKYIQVTIRKLMTCLQAGIGTLSGAEHYPMYVLDDITEVLDSL